MKRYGFFFTTAAVGITLIGFATFVGVTTASPPSGVSFTLLARGVYDDFKVKSVPDSPVDFKVNAKSPVDVVVRRHDYSVGSHTGWHSHPGPVFITVTQGTLTYYSMTIRTARRTTSRRPAGSSTTRADTWSAMSPASLHRT